MPLLLCSLLLVGGLVHCIATGKVWLHSGPPLCSEEAHVCGFMDRKSELSQCFGRILEESLRREMIFWVKSIYFCWSSQSKLILFQKCWNCGKFYRVYSQCYVCFWIKTEQTAQFWLFFLLLDCLLYSKIFLDLLWVTVFMPQIFPKDMRLFSSDHFLGNRSICCEMK